MSRDRIANIDTEDFSTRQDLEQAQRLFSDMLHGGDIPVKLNYTARQWAYCQRSLSALNSIPEYSQMWKWLWLKNDDSNDDVTVISKKYGAYRLSSFQEKWGRLAGYKIAEDQEQKLKEDGNEDLYWIYGKGTHEICGGDVNLCLIESNKLASMPVEKLARVLHSDGAIQMGIVADNRVNRALQKVITVTTQKARWVQRDGDTSELAVEMHTPFLDTMRSEYALWRIISTIDSNDRQYSVLGRVANINPDKIKSVFLQKKK